MTVQELIDLLAELPLDYKVVVSDNDILCSIEVHVAENTRTVVLHAGRP